MILEFIQIDFDWSNDSSLILLRSLIVKELNSYGEPLRWAITSCSIRQGYRRLKVEAVVINETKV